MALPVPQQPVEESLEKRAVPFPAGAQSAADWAERARDCWLLWELEYTELGGEG